jgi:uncharacterized membrane-anchored protein
VRALALAIVLCLGFAPIVRADDGLKFSLSPTGNDAGGKINLLPPANNAAAQPPASPGPANSYVAYLHSRLINGPAKIALRDQATLDLPQGYGFLPEAVAKDVWKRDGHVSSDGILGMILPTGYGEDWLIFMEFSPSGFVRDEDAKTWDTDALLNAIRDGTARDNERRQKLGVAQLEVVGWIEKPHYDDKTRRLIWSLAVRQKESAPQADNSVNYRMAVLGRQGYISMTMVTGESAIAGEKSTANALLSDVQFDTGKRYSDFNPSTDRVAEFGLAALIGGLAIKKLGLFAVLAAFFAKAAKFIVVIFVGALAWFRRLFRRRKPAPDASVAVPDLRAAPATAVASSTSVAMPPTGESTEPK